MSFYRIKNIKGKEYAYLVENEWAKGSSRQKVKDYLGRAYRFDLKHNVDFLEYLKADDAQAYVEKNDKNRIISDLIEWELFKFGINKEDFSIDLKGIKIQKNKKNAVILINDGFMCSLTLKNLLGFRVDGNEEAKGYDLARAFIESGIKVPKEIFVGIFGKLNKTSDKVKRDALTW